MSDISKDLNHLKFLINTHNIACTNVNIDTLEARVNNLREQITETIASIEEADREQGLFSDRPTKPCPMKIPSYSGTPSKDFVIFKEKFRKAAKNNRITKTNQSEILREALTGRAALLVLERTFHNPNLKCNVCEFAAKSERGLKTHRTRKHDNCNWCDYICDDEEEMKKHKFDQHVEYSAELLRNCYL